MRQRRVPLLQNSGRRRSTTCWRSWMRWRSVRRTWPNNRVIRNRAFRTAGSRRCCGVRQGSCNARWSRWHRTANHSRMVIHNNQAAAHNSPARNSLARDNLDRSSRGVKALAVRLPDRVKADRSRAHRRQGVLLQEGLRIREWSRRLADYARPARR